MGNDFKSVQSKPYQWPLDNKFNEQNTAIIVIDMQRDFL